MKRPGVGGAWIAREMRDCASAEIVPPCEQSIEQIANGPLVQRLRPDSLASLAQFIGMDLHAFVQRYDHQQA